MTMRKIAEEILRVCAGMFLLLAISIPSTGHAVSFQPPFRLSPDSGSVVVKGGTAYLFHSGTSDITNTIRGGDIFIVYRITPSCKIEEVGEVRFVKFVGDTYMEAEVIQGELRSGDIAKKGNISCIVVPMEPCPR